MALVANALSSTAETVITEVPDRRLGERDSLGDPMTTCALVPPIPNELIPPTSDLRGSLATEAFSCKPFSPSPRLLFSGSANSDGGKTRFFTESAALMKPAIPAAPSR